jgi:hypothetical protein
MTDERRRDERTDSYEIVRVTAKDQHGDELVFPIMVRDRSPKGFGGVYVGANPLNHSIDYSLEDSEGQVHTLRIAWISPVASNVFTLGFSMI